MRAHVMSFTLPGFDSRARLAVPHQSHAANLVVAATRIINPIAIADIEAALAAAVPPDRVLDKPGKDLWK